MKVKWTWFPSLKAWNNPRQIDMPFKSINLQIYNVILKSERLRKRENNFQGLLFCYVTTFSRVASSLSLMATVFWNVKSCLEGYAFLLAYTLYYTLKFVLFVLLEKKSVHTHTYVQPLGTLGGVMFSKLD